MGGLLYKDFVAVKGKADIRTMIILTIVYIVLRMLFPGTEDIKGFIVENDTGELVNVLDTFFFMAESTVLFLGAFFINAWCSKIVMNDDKNKIRGFLSAMPFDKKTYVASKYVFIGITAYVVFSVYLIWHVADLAFMRQGWMVEISYLLTGFALPLISLLLLAASLEFPLYFLFGKGKAKMVTVSFWMVIGFLVLGFLLFGDLKLVENWDIGHLIDWANAHEFGLTLTSVLSPIIVLVIYYISYRITAHFYVRKEGTNE